MVNRFRSTERTGRSVGSMISTEGWHVTEDADGPHVHGTPRAAPDPDPRSALAAALVLRPGPPGDGRPLGRERQQSGTGARARHRRDRPRRPLADAWKAGIAAPAHHTADPTAAGAASARAGCLPAARGRRPVAHERSLSGRRPAGRHPPEPPRTREGLEGAAHQPGAGEPHRARMRRRARRALPHA